MISVYTAARKMLSFMICDNKVSSAHSFCLVNKQVASLNIKIICHNLVKGKGREERERERELSKQFTYDASSKSHTLYRLVKEQTNQNSRSRT